METHVLPIDGTTPDTAILARAAELLRSGELVAFPTETVYGLGADALNSQAVKKIYEAKGRPSRNPLIVHVVSVEQAKRLTSHWPKHAEMLVAHFWPGPLTLVLQKDEKVPDEVTGGGSTVAIRMPSHPIARALINAAGTPLAAPSANVSSKLSPTSAAHVKKDLDGVIAMILDGGPSSGGIESTVIDLTEDAPRLLRPGLLPLKTIEEVIGPVEQDIPQDEGNALKSPGLLTKHYAPNTKIFVTEEPKYLIKKLLQKKQKLACLTLGEHMDGVACIVMPGNADAYAARLYGELHALDDGRFDVIVAQLPPNEDAWLGVRDRLLRAAAKE